MQVYDEGCWNEMVLPSDVLMFLVGDILSRIERNATDLMNVGY
jgi:hypothetical protein